jgi:hypothetical protein
MNTPKTKRVWPRLMQTTNRTAFFNIAAFNIAAKVGAGRVHAA